MVEWLVPIGAFFPLTSLYLGALRIEPAGGSGLRQVLGLVLTFAAYLAVWRVLHSLLAVFGPVLGGVVAATLVAVLALPLEARLGYLLVGVKLRRIHASH